MIDINSLFGSVIEHDEPDGMIGVFCDNCHREIGIFENKIIDRWHGKVTLCHDCAELLGRLDEKDD